MKPILNNILNCLNNKGIRALLSLLLSLLIVILIPGDAYLSIKLGKILFCVLICLIVYAVLSIPGIFIKEKPDDTYNIVDDFYNVLYEEKTLEENSSYASSSVKLMEKTEVAIKERNVMIGTVRTPEQYKFNLENNCYYTPARFVSRDNMPLKKVVIYESDKNGKPVIMRFGNVKNAKLVNRSTIPVPSGRKNGDEKYWYFELDGWKQLENPVIVKDTYRGKPLYTNSFLLENCDYSYQLVSVNSSDEYTLSKAVENLLESSDNNLSPHKITDNCKLSFENGYLIIKNNRGDSLCKMPAYLYKRRPKQMFDKLKLYVK